LRWASTPGLGGCKPSLLRVLQLNVALQVACSFVRVGGAAGGSNQCETQWSPVNASAPFPCSKLMEYRSQNDGPGEMTPALRLVAGAGAGIIAMSATYPLDMVRGRLTVQEGKGGQYRGIWHAASVIMKEVCGQGRPYLTCLSRGLRYPHKE